MAKREVFPESVHQSGGWLGDVTALDEPHATPNDGDFMHQSAGSGGGALILNIADVTWQFVAVNLIELWFRIKAEPGSSENFTPFLHIGGVSYDGTTRVSQTTATTYSHVWPLDPSDNKPWTLDKLTGSYLRAGMAMGGNHPNSEQQMTQFSVEVDDVSAPALVGETRAGLSLDLRLARVVIPLVGLHVPFGEGADEIGGLVMVSHPLGPHAHGLGWRSREWERRPLVVLEETIDPGDMSETLQCLDLVRSRYACLLWDSMRSREPAGAASGGVARLNGLRSHTRASDAWVDTFDGRVIRVTRDVEQINHRGQSLEPLRTNKVLRSSMVSQLTGLTAIGTAGQTTADGTDLLFAADVTGFSLKIARNATAEDQGRSWPAFAVLANDVGRLSVNHKNDSGLAIAVRVQRTNGDYWRDSDQTWQATVQDNIPPVKTTKHPDNRWISKVMDVGASDTSLTVSVVHRSADPSGTISHVYHMQWEKGRWASSWIVTDAAEVPREPNRLTFESEAEPHVWLVDRGTCTFRLRTHWDRGDITALGVNLALLRLEHDGALVHNREIVRYEPATGRIAFDRGAGGDAPAAAFKEIVSATRGVEYKVAVRWCSEKGELGLPAFTQSVFVDGVKGTDAAIARVPIPGATVRIYGGWTPLAAGLEPGVEISDLNVYAYPVPDEEIPRLFLQGRSGAPT